MRSLRATVSYPVLVNNPALLARILPSLKQAAGAANVREIPLVHRRRGFRLLCAGSAGRVLLRRRTFQWTSIPRPRRANHSPQFFVDEGALAVGTRALLQVSLDYLSGGTVR